MKGGSILGLKKDRHCFLKWRCMIMDDIENDNMCIMQAQNESYSIRK